MLQHRFFIGNTTDMGFWAEDVFRDVESLEQLETNLQTVAFPEDENYLHGHDPLSMILGDGWEAFGELFFASFGLHPHLKVSDLIMCPPSTVGIDWTHTHGYNLRPAVGQAKYVGKAKAATKALRAKEDMRLERMLVQAQNVHGVDVNDTENIIVFTNADSIYYWDAGKLLCNKVTCVGRKKIKALTDDNLAFWNNCRRSITETNNRIIF